MTDEIFKNNERGETRIEFQQLRKTMQIKGSWSLYKFKFKKCLQEDFKYLQFVYAIVLCYQLQQV